MWAWHDPATPGARPKQLGLRTWVARRLGVAPIKFKLPARTGRTPRRLSPDAARPLGDVTRQRARAAVPPRRPGLTPVCDLSPSTVATRPGACMSRWRDARRPLCRVLATVNVVLYLPMSRWRDTPAPPWLGGVLPAAPARLFPVKSLFAADQFSATATATRAM